MEHAILGLSSLGIAPSLKPTCFFFFLLDRSLSPVFMPESQHQPGFSAPNHGAFTPHLAPVQENPNSTAQGRS